MLDQAGPEELTPIETSGESSHATYGRQPSDWGRWGVSDDVGRTNLLDPERVLQAAQEIVTGHRFSLALPLCGPGGDPNMPNRTPLSEHVMTHDASHYADGRSQPQAGGLEYADDWLKVHCHGTTHMDGLGHAYLDEQLWNGAPGDSNIGGLRRAGVDALAKQGIVGRAVLVDVPRNEGVPHLEMGRTVHMADIAAALANQGTEVGPGDTLILRTGSFKIFYEQEPDAYYEQFREPGVSYEPELVEFFNRNDIAGFGSDTMGNEQPYSDELDAAWPLHIVLQRNLGIVFHEALWLEEWAEACARDGRYSAFYVAAPLRLVGGSAAPMNPIVIR